MSSIPDGQLLTAILELIERDSKNHKLFDSPAISLDTLATSLHVRPSSIDPEHVSDLIRPLAETASLFGVPRSPAVRIHRKGFRKEIWIVFHPVPTEEVNVIEIWNEDQQVRSTEREIETPRPIPLDLPIPLPRSRSRSRSQSRPTTPTINYTTPPPLPLPAPLSRSRSRPQTPVLPRPPLRRVRSDHHISTMSPSIPSAPLPLPPTKELHLIPTLPGGSEYTAQPRSAEFRGDSGTPRRGLFKAFGLTKKREKDVPQIIEATAPPASEAIPKMRKYGTHIRTLSEDDPPPSQDPYDSTKDVPRPLPLAVRSPAVPPIVNGANGFLFPPRPNARGRLREDSDESGHDDDDASFEIISSYGDDDDGDRQDITPDSDAVNAELEDVRPEGGKDDGEDEENSFTHDSEAKFQIKKPGEGRAGPSPRPEERQTETAGDKEDQDRSSRRDEEPDRSDRVLEESSGDNNGDKRKHKRRREEEDGQGKKEERRRHRRLPKEEEEDKGERDSRHRHRDKGEAKGEEGERPARKDRHEERKRLRAEKETKSRSKAKAHLQESDVRHRHHQRHRSTFEIEDEDGDEERPPTPWLAVAFDGLPFGPDPNSMQLSSWVKDRWSLIFAELVGVLGLVYIIQATGL